MTLTIPTPLVLTHSDITSFLRCRRAFRWNVVDDYSKEEKLTGALALGTRVHQAVEMFHTDGIDPVDAHDMLASDDRAKVEAMGNDWLEVELDEDLVYGRNCVTAYRQWVLDTDPYKNLDVVGVERVVDMPLLDGRVLLQGKVDLLLRDRESGDYKIEDLKTVASSRASSAQNFALRTYQHHVYGGALRDAGYEVRSARYVHLKKVKSLARTTDPVLVTDVPVFTRTNQTAMTSIERIVSDILRVMEADDDAQWYPTPQDACSWCQFAQPCTMKDDGRGAEKDVLDANFRHGIRLLRYGV
jgi:hypothetical protein